MKRKLQCWIDNQPESLSSNIITIPVVVHIVYYNSVENIKRSTNDDGRYFKSRF